MDRHSHFASTRVVKYAGIALWVGLCLAGGSFVYQVFAPIGPESKTVVVYVPRGIGAYQIALKLKEAGLVRSPRFVQLLVGLTGTSRRLKAGEYELSRSMSLWGIVKYLREGKVKLYPFLVREGVSMKEIARDLERQGFGQSATFELYTRRPYLCREYGVPPPLESLEGYAFPDTYYLSREMTEFEVLAMMLRNFSVKFDAKMEARAKEMGLTRHEVVTLASIIEGEAEVDEERAKISGVFHNRLRDGEKLQSCVTVLYAIGKKKRLFEKDLLIESIYNTYRRPGLPPTPINNPGKASLMAALYPAEVPYKFFVSQGDRTHFFSEDWKGHRENIKKSKMLRAARQKKPSSKSR